MENVSGKGFPKGVIVGTQGVSSCYSSYLHPIEHDNFILSSECPPAKSRDLLIEDAIEK